jgi:alpha-D-xyloside xylohydrolase
MGAELSNTCRDYLWRWRVVLGSPRLLIAFAFVAGASVVGEVALALPGYVGVARPVYDGTMPETKVQAPTSAQRWAFAVKGGSLAFTPYGPNILHVTFAPGATDRVVPSGWGILASPSGESQWKVDAVALALGSAQVAVKVDPGAGGFDATRPDGTPICRFLGGTLKPATVSGIATHAVDGAFAAGDDEHFFGAGQHQDGALDLRGRNVGIWSTYGSREPVGVPFIVSTRKYGLIWDNPSKTRLACAVGGKTTWNSEAGDAISFFLIVGDSADEVYAGYRALTGVTPIPPRASLGLIQAKARYASQQEVLDIAAGYRKRDYPCDEVVVDYLHWKKLGDLSLDPKFWPDPKAMNAQLHDEGFRSVISVWPDFAKGTANYEEVVSQKLVLTDATGAPAGMKNDPHFHRDACIDSTNPAARVWLWDKINAGYRADGFDYYWMDETEPDVGWHDMFCHLGPCALFNNVYPLMHNSAVYDGQRSVSEERVMILTRAAYLGSQRNGTTFWSSDISPAWDTLRVQVPTAINECATGLPYWSSDTAGWAPLPKASHPAKLLLDPSDARAVIGQDDDYPELFTRWVQFSAFCPTFRLHGLRKQNEVWSFGKAAEPILVKYLKLRYRLLPYIYSEARRTNQTGAPFLRALFMDFPGDPNVLPLTDEYMFGPAFLVAPITQQATTQRKVYLPAGADWYDYWTNRRYKGGQEITADAPIDTLPLYVRAGSILPLGEDVQNAQKPQKITEVRIYPGADGEFALYDDDGHTYAYESGQFSLARLRYVEKSRAFSVTGSVPTMDAGIRPTFVTASVK